FRSGCETPGARRRRAADGRRGAGGRRGRGRRPATSARTWRARSGERRNSRSAAKAQASGRRRARTRYGRRCHLQDQARTTRSRRASDVLVGADAHAVERAIDEGNGDAEEHDGQADSQLPVVALVELDGQLGGEQAEEGGELDDGIERDGAGVLEGVADGVADDG